MNLAETQWSLTCGVTRLSEHCHLDNAIAQAKYEARKRDRAVFVRQSFMYGGQLHVVRADGRVQRLR